MQHMNLADVLAREDILVDPRASGKKRVLAELSMHAGRRLGIEPDVLLEALMHREKLGSTGMGGGIAIPHTRMSEIASPFGVLARLRHSTEFEAVDEAPVDIVFLLLLPKQDSTPQLNALAAVAKALRDPKTLDAIRRAKGRDVIYEAFVSRA